MINSNQGEQVWQSIEEEFRFLNQLVMMHEGESPWQYHRWLISKVPANHKEEIISRQLELIDELIQIDAELCPETPPKWAMLTKVFLLQEQSSIVGQSNVSSKTIRELIEKLSACDPFRKNYYKHLLEKISV